MVQEYTPMAQLKNIWDKMDETHIFDGQWTTPTYSIQFWIFEFYIIVHILLNASVVQGL
jgi:hypothetical protein